MILVQLNLMEKIKKKEIKFLENQSPEIQEFVKNFQKNFKYNPK